VDKERSLNPVAVGGSLALLAAATFGVTTPLIQRFGVHAGPFATAALLYGGAATASLATRTKSEARMRRAPMRRLLAVALLGAVIAPVCLAWGLQRTDATAASLLLNFEAVFTVLLARLLFKEHVGVRVAIAVGLMMAAGALLVTRGRGMVGGPAGWGEVAVLTAALGWAADNTLTRPLADLDATHVVLWKGALGAAVSLGMARLTREAFPDWIEASALVGCGAIGYGVSLRLYLLAQRRIGAARTASIFAVAPFIGAAVAWAMGDRNRGWVTIGAGGLFGLAIYLHLTERHGHSHAHGVLEHEHAHRHDDDHHDHAHDVYPRGEHTHAHRHEPQVHAHPHGPDTHHRHEH
jgi:drug/metabolite transporter (DMT)-like permease